MKPVRQLKFLDSSQSQKRFRTGFYLSLLLVLALDLIAFFLAGRQGHFSWEGVPFFYAVYGFTACVVLIFMAKLLRWIVRRKEGYYD